MRGTPRCSVCPRGYSTASNAGGAHSHLRIASFPKQSMSALGRNGTVGRRFNEMPHNNQFQRSVNSRLRRLSPPAELGRYAASTRAAVDGRKQSAISLPHPAQPHDLGTCRNIARGQDHP